MRLYSMEGNRQRLDGGAMFGNCPRALWARWLPPDDRDRVPLACRPLLVETDGGRRILFEAGIGAFFAPHLRDRYGVVDGSHVLLDSLAARGLSDTDIDVVVLSHLHFDHAGGLLSAYEEGSAPRLLFPNARYVASRAAFDRASEPHRRDRASFVPELMALLSASGRLELVDGDHSAVTGDHVRFFASDGHTPGLLVSRIETGGAPVYFLADLAPGTAWVHLPITMGYDRFPERLIDEKERLFARVADEGGWGFFTHDPNVAVARIVPNDNGSFTTSDPHPTLDGALPG